jgi:hypothetical protein
MKYFLIFLSALFFSSLAIAGFDINYQGSYQLISADAACESTSVIYDHYDIINRGTSDINGALITTYTCKYFNASNQYLGELAIYENPLIVPPAPCDAPNYIDSASGECLPPQEICYDSFDSGISFCYPIGAPNPEPSQNCIIDDAGQSLCLDADPLCYSVDGKTVCPSSDSVCGYKNDVFSCVTPAEEGCGTFNGELLCFTPDGIQVDPLSPDHPDNGGNLDGDDTNDVTDSRTELEGGDPDNQPGPDTSPIQTLDADRSTEKTSRDQLVELKSIDDRMRKMGQGIQPTGNEGSDLIDSGVTGLLNGTGIDGLTSGIDSNSFSSSDLLTVPGIAQGLIPTGACVSYSADVLGFGTFQVTCEDTLSLRSILAWILYAITAVYIFQLLTTPVRS